MRTPSADQLRLFRYSALTSLTGAEFPSALLTIKNRSSPKLALYATLRPSGDHTGSSSSNSSIANGANRNCDWVVVAGDPARARIKAIASTPETAIHNRGRRDVGGPGEDREIVARSET